MWLFTMTYFFDHRDISFCYISVYHLQYKLLTIKHLKYNYLRIF